MRGVEAELQPCVYRKMGLSIKNRQIFITRVGLRYHQTKKYDDTPSDRFLNYRFKNF